MKRVLLKLSGEALAGDKHTGFDEPTVTEVAKQVKQIVDGGTEVGIVIGGGNLGVEAAIDPAAISGEDAPARRSTAPKRIRSVCSPRS